MLILKAVDPTRGGYTPPTGGGGISPPPTLLGPSGFFHKKILRAFFRVSPTSLGWVSARSPQAFKKSLIPFAGDGTQL